MDTQLALNMMGAAAVIPYLIEGVKKSSWFPWLTTETERLNRLLGIAVALAVTAGLTYTWEPTTRTLTMQIPTLWQAGQTFWHAAVQWGLQQYVYKTSVSPRPVVAGAQSVNSAK